MLIPRRARRVCILSMKDWHKPPHANKPFQLLEQVKSFEVRLTCFIRGQETNKINLFFNRTWTIIYVASQKTNKWQDDENDD